jgi:hypothetical protein
MAKRTSFVGVGLATPSQLELLGLGWAALHLGVELVFSLLPAFVLVGVVICCAGVRYRGSQRDWRSEERRK